jgi:hypothetical protein
MSVSSPIRLSELITQRVVKDGAIREILGISVADAENFGPKSGGGPRRSSRYPFFYEVNVLEASARNSFHSSR